MAKSRSAVVEETKPIRLGSGLLYVTEFTGTIPEFEAIEIKENELGAISSGATASYNKSVYTAKDDLKRVSKTVITDETVILKAGVMTFNGNTIEKMVSTARATIDTVKKRRTVKIGGAANDDGKKYLIHFVHKDAIDGDVRLQIVGKNTAGFELAFTQAKETVINAEFTAEPIDDTGVLCIYTEDVKIASTPDPDPPIA